MGAGQAYTHDATGLVFRAVTLQVGLAKVTVCRKTASGHETAATCTAGLDGDCDGLVGAADPACLPWLAPAPLGSK